VSSSSCVNLFSKFGIFNIGKRHAKITSCLDFKSTQILMDPEEGDMDIPSAIMIKLPEVFGAKEARELRRQLKSKLATERPYVVVDLSRVKKIDLTGLEGLLRCMEEIAKQDGSVELGGISPEASAMLELTRMNQLFQKFPAPQAEVSRPVSVPEPVSNTEQAPVAQPQPVAA
jgi:anti-anti-sigma factor